ncbi:peroxidase family protein [Mycobacterium sp.]|uniref:peroxidase family protein n=1 Tax=Mycobacterium sp. TaxID=1785 RepID=UPI002D823601|nr:peroxidase family protein [Mycobacterium sp.]
MAAAQAIDHRIGWDKLPKSLGLLVLIGLRDKLRAKNLHDTNAVPAQNLPPIDPYTSAVLTARKPDGTYNDLSEPRMGMACARFGRNIPLDKAWPETGERLMTPNPRTVSRRVLTRKEFIPATGLNTLAATWIQFMVKDWISHGHGDFTRAFTPELEPDDAWPEPELVIPATIADPTRTDDESFPPTFVNEHSAWWDGSVIYGDSLEQQKLLRSGKGGKLNVSDRLPTLLTDPDIDPSVDPSLIPGFWTGLAMMGVLFCLEHNSICDALAAENPHWEDEELFQRARLVLAALVAKIHTVEWTPGVISHPTTVAALRANWYGIAGQKIRDTFGRISSNDLISGITGGTVDHFGVPYSLTEEFSIVYRMHPLIPDDYEIRDWQTDNVEDRFTLRQLSGPAGKAVLAEADLANLFYTFGTSHPGAIVLENFPKHLQEFQRPDGKYTDLAATDILRTRELGVPRYNEFRRQLHLLPVKDFADLTDDVAMQETLQELYGDIEDVDTIVGMFAEKRPAGFGFSDTAFRIFILMATRRLNSDRFLTDDFTPEVYSPTGYRWIVENGMTSVLLRHFPQLRSALRDSANPFAPWRKATD